MKYTGCFSRMEIENFIPPDDSVLICIFDPGTSYPDVARNKQGWRFISFHDFWDTGPQKEDRKKFPALSDLMPPASKKDLETIVGIIDKFQNHNIFASCEAGISRSAAIREYLLRRGWVMSERQQYRGVHPNSHILAGLERLDYPIEDEL